MTEKNVATPSAAVMADGEKRAMIRALLGGTATMRAAGNMYLPREMAESDTAYAQRLARSFLFNGYGKTVQDMAGKVFSRPIVVGEDVPPAIREWLENADYAGQNLDVFGHRVFNDALNEGVSYILTDMSPALETGPRPPTVAETRDRRPWWVHIPRAKVLGWKRGVFDGREVLTQFRYMDDTEEDDGFSEKPVQQVRVYTRTDAGVVWEVWRKSEKAGWLIFQSGTMTVPEIPIAPVYIKRTGFFDGCPPLADLAEINVAHWQSQSDQRHILHVARVPILFGAGLPTEGGKVEIGAGRMIAADQPDAKLGYVEHSGAAIGAGRDDLKDLEFQMQTMGLELLIPKPGGQSATGAAIDQARMNTPLAFMATALQDALEASLGFMAQFGGLASGGSLTVNTDFGISPDSASDMATLLGAVNAKAITRATFVNEMIRRRILSDGIDAEEEVVAAMNEGLEGSEDQP